MPSIFNFQNIFQTITNNLRDGKQNFTRLCRTKVKFDDVCKWEKLKIKENIETKKKHYSISVQKLSKCTYIAYSYRYLIFS